MKLSVVIVNYNVEYFLEQCLLSVKKALSKVKGEIIVVDNHSVDGSIQMLKEKFPFCTLIENKENLGFSKANNQGIKVSKGEYILLLNPDTLVEEDTFEKIIDFLDNHPDAGGLGVKMIDGKGNFLPESKRGLPTPKVAFYKIFGLSRLFPNSTTFGQYHLTYLDQNKTHEVDILSGAFMAIRKTAIEKSGLLDEDFFMYGEDIDLSYRIQKAGYKNYYFPFTRIIHYKGESTKKSSVNYVFVFYNAMIIFAKKHFGSGNAALFTLLIRMAIYLRAAMAIANRVFKTFIASFIDFALILIGLTLIQEYYGTLTNKIYSEEVKTIAFPIYGLIWVISIFFSSGYDKPFKLTKLFKGGLIGTAIILVLYSLLDEGYRFSRALILIGFPIVFLSGYISRHLLSYLNIADSKIYRLHKKRMLLVGSPDEVKRVLNLMHQTGIKPEFYAFISPSNEKIENDRYIGTLPSINKAIEVFKINEIVYCAKNLSSNQIIKSMSGIDNKELDFKIAPPESLFVIGSNSINSSGEYYSASSINSINNKNNVRNKWIFDYLISILLLLFSPIIIWGIKSKRGFFENIIKVILGKYSWVGYNQVSPQHKLLPKIKQGILNPSDRLTKSELSLDVINKLNMLYAKDYHLQTDLSLLYKNIHKLGRILQHEK